MRGFEALPDYVWAALSWSALGLSSPTTARFVSKNGNADDNDQLFKVKMKIEKKIGQAMSIEIQFLMESACHQYMCITDERVYLTRKSVAGVHVGPEKGCLPF